jgi:hypothetical protein
MKIMTAVTPKPASLTIDLYLNERTPRLLKRGVFVCRLMVDEYKLSQKKQLIDSHQVGWVEMSATI